nr:complement C1q protein [uncultured Mediterranean phage uvMED]
MSTLKVDTILKRTGTGTITLGQSGDTISLPSGTTLAVSGTATGVGGDNKPSFQAGLSSNQSITQNTSVKLNCDTELFDTDGTYDNSSNYRFTPAVAGKYYIYACSRYTVSTDFDNFQLSIRKNGSDVLFMNRRHLHFGSQYIGGVVDSNTTDYFEAFIYQDTGGAINVNGTVTMTYFGGYKLIT